MINSCSRLFFRCINSLASLAPASYSKMSNKPLIAVCQLCATEDKENNCKITRDLIESAGKAGAQVIFLPEAFDYIAANKQNSVAMAEPLTGPCISSLKELARELKVWLSLGGFHEKISDDYISNSHLIIDSNGEIVAKYEKIHLFDVNLPSKGLILSESSYVRKGSEIIPPIKTPAGKLGMSICYDLRFPEMALMNKSMGAEIIAYPSAFSFATGAHHWEVLLRARAIENQVFVVAAAQTGLHNKVRHSWGHAMVVDPFGTVIAQCTEGNGFALARIDLEFIKKLGSEMPIQDHKRYDLFPPLKLPTIRPMSIDTKGDSYFSFGQVKVPKEAVFCQTRHSVAFTNKRCVVPGHVLVASIRPVAHLEDLTPVEISDLFQLVQKVDNVVRNHADTCSSLIAVQNGQHSGQTIQHVHVHILPRKPGDFKRNDDVYTELEKHDKDNRPERTPQEMIEEAKKFKPFFMSSP